MHRIAPAIWFALAAALLRADAPPSPAPVPLAELDAADPGVRARAGDALLRRLQQLHHDDESGASRPVPSPFWGEGGRIPAREQRKQLIEEAFTRKPSPELLPAITWVLDHERLVEPQLAAARQLARIEGRGALQLIERLLEAPHPASGVVAALAPPYVKAAGARSEVLERLATHPAPQVRSVARSALTTRGRAVAAFAEASLITPRLRASLASVLSLARTPISTHATLVEIDLAAQRGGWGREQSHLRGFLIAERDGRVQLLTSHFEERTLGAGDIARRSDVPVAEEITRVTRLRGTREGAAQLSFRGDLTAQFEPRFVTGWEVLLAAWLVARDDTAAAGRLLAPVLEQCPDERFLSEVARDQWATRLTHTMLEEFSYARDRAATLEIARHLSGRFVGHPSQPLAEKLARELSQAEKGAPLQLPTPEAWKKLAASMTRPQRLDYLLDRLVLLNCIQQGQPGGVSFKDPQFEVPMRTLMQTWRSKQMPPQRINPFAEIQGLGLTVADVAALAPRLSDDRYIPTFSFWRDFHPSRHLYTVTEVVAELIDTVARTELAHAEEFLRGDAATREAGIERVRSWAKANASRSEADRLIEIVRTTRAVGSMYFEELVQSLEKLDAKKAAPAVLGRLADPQIADYDVAYLLRAASRLDGPATAATAAKYLAHASPGVRLAAGFVVYQHGDRPAGRRVVAEALARGTHSSLSLHDVLPVVRALVGVGGAEDLDAARVVFARDYFEESWESDRKPIIEAFGDKAGPGLYAFYLRRISNKRTDGGSTSYAQGKAPQRRTFAEDGARELLEGPYGKRTGITWPADETEAAKAAVLTQLKVWLEERLNGRSH